MSRTNEENALLDEVRKAFQAIDYNDELIRENYQFADYAPATSASSAIVRQIELVTFAQSLVSLRSAAFGVTFTDRTGAAFVEEYRYLGAAQILTLHRRDKTFRRWRLRGDAPPELKDEKPLDSVGAIIRSHKEDWNPQSVLRARTFPFDPGPAQLDFADAGLIPALEAELRPKLSRLLQSALGEGKATYRENHAGVMSDEAIASLYRLVFRLLAAKLQIDRRDRPDWADLEVRDLLREVEQAYPDLLNAQSVLQDMRTRQTVWQALNTGLRLQNISVETLAYVYEHTLVPDDVRKRNAIHATPPEVAEFMVRHLPLEELLEDERHIFEPFCGHAPFLTAAMGRLRELPLSPMSHAEKHDYLKQMLSGIELEPLAHEIAVQSLILADYSNPNGWNIIEADAFHDERFDALLSKASAVFCNPPYRDIEGEERQRFLPQPVLRTETEAVRRIVAGKPRMLALVLPRVALDRTHDREWRNMLAANYRNISVIVLPDTVFHFSQAEAVLLIAHNEETAAQPYFFGQVMKPDYDHFKQSSALSWQHEANTLKQDHNGDFLLWQTTRQPIWNALAALPILKDVAKLNTGIRYKSQPSSHIFVTRQQNSSPGVGVIKDFLEPYSLNDVCYLSVDRGDILWSALDLPWQHPKVLVNCIRISRGIWCLTGATDKQGMYATRQFDGVWPLGETPIEVLAAVLNGPVANAFAYDFRVERHNKIPLLDRIPFPRFSEEQTDLIVSLVNDYRSDREWLRQEPERAVTLEPRCGALLLQIDAAVLEAYGLTAEQETQLLQVFEGVKRPLLPFTLDHYGEDFARAKQAIAAKYAWNRLITRYHALVDKEFESGLTPEEEEEQEQLSNEIDAEEARENETILADVPIGFK